MITGGHRCLHRVKIGLAGADVRQVKLSRRAAALLTGALLATVLPAQAAHAESAAQARSAARRAAAEVAALQPQVAAATRAYEQALQSLTSSVSLSVAADADADAAAQESGLRQRRANNRVRALYMSGGSAVLLASVLDAGSATDALRRVAYVQRLVQSGSAEAAASARVTARLRSSAARLESRADSHVVTAMEVRERYDELAALLARSNAALDRLSARARSLEEAEAAAARLRALAAAVSRSAADRVAHARAGVVPADYKRLYVAAARTCRGLSWTVLAAIGQVESGHGRNAGTSYAGAQGPMQFMPSTFAHYGVDGDKDGSVDIFSPADAIYSAARYLCANGAGGGDAALARAIWHYNHADWYVQLVLRIAGQLAAQPR